MPLKILLVEDDFIIKMFIEKVLNRMGCNLIGYAQTGQEGIDIAIEKKPDLILMDIGIKGDIDGIETAIKISEIFNPLLIYITGNSDIATVKRAKKTNPLKIIHKPIDEESLYKDLYAICYANVNTE